MTQATVTEMKWVLARLSALRGYLEIFNSHPDDPRRDMRDLVAYVDTQPARLRALFIEAHNVNGWNSVGDVMRSLRNALFTPDEQVKYLPPWLLQ